MWVVLLQVRADRPDSAAARLGGHGGEELRSHAGAIPGAAARQQPPRARGRRGRVLSRLCPAQGREVRASVDRWPSRL